MGPQSPEALSRERLFTLVCDEAMKDGVLEPVERELLARLAGFLRLSSDEAGAALLEAKDRFDRGELGMLRPLEGGALYAKALHVVMEDGVVDDQEKELLAGLRQLLGIDDAQHRLILDGLRDRRSRSSGPDEAHDPESLDVGSSSAVRGPRRVDPVLGLLAVGAAFTMVLSGLVVMLGPRILPFETLRRPVKLSRMVQGESTSTPRNPGGNLNFSMPGVEKLDPVTLAGGAAYYVGLEATGVAPRRTKGSFVVDLGMRLVVVNAHTLQPLEVTTSTRERSELGGTVASTFFRFSPPASGSFVLMYQVTARNAGFEAELFVTRFPALSERLTFAVGGVLSVVVLVVLALILGSRVQGRERAGGLSRGGIR